MGDQAKYPRGPLGTDANVVARRNASVRLPGGKPGEGEPHAGFGEGVLETERTRGDRRDWQELPQYFAIRTHGVAPPRLHPTSPARRSRLGGGSAAVIYEGPIACQGPMTRSVVELGTFARHR